MKLRTIVAATVTTFLVGCGSGNQSVSQAELAEHCEFREAGIMSQLDFTNSIDNYHINNRDCDTRVTYREPDGGQESIIVPGEMMAVMATAGSITALTNIITSNNLNNRLNSLTSHDHNRHTSASKDQRRESGLTTKTFRERKAHANTGRSKSVSSRKATTSRSSSVSRSSKPTRSKSSYTSSTRRR